MSRIHLYIVFILISGFFLACSEDVEREEIWSDESEIGFWVSKTDNGISRGVVNAEVQVNHTDTFLINNPADNTHPLICTTEISYIPAITSSSRAILIGNDNISDIKDIGVVAYGDWYGPVLMDNEKFERGDDGLYHTTSSTVKYWPGDENKKLDFYTYTPYMEGSVTSYADHSSPLLNYTVQSMAESQKDLMLAVNRNIPGNNNNLVSLSFRHLLAGVRVIISSIPTGSTVESVEFSNVVNSGSIEMGAEPLSWTLGKSDGVSFSGKPSVGSDGNTSEVTFMMMPQELGPDVWLNLTFKEANGKNTTLGAVIPTKEWPLGFMTTYRISVKDYEIYFHADNEKTVDAHYVIQPIKIHVDERLTDGWTLTSKSSDLTLRKDLTELEKQGYWIEEEKGTNEITGTDTGDVTVYAFITGNISDDSKTHEIELRPTNENIELSVTFSLNQVCPLWNDGIGFEVIESEDGALYNGMDNQYIWGYFSDRTANYKFQENIFSYGFAWNALKNAYGVSADNGYYRAESKTSLFSGEINVYFDYSVLSNLSGISDNEISGIENTKGLYNYTGRQDFGAIETWIINYKTGLLGFKYTLQNEDGSQLSNEKTSVIVALQKNKFHQNEVEDENGIIHFIPKITDDEIIWFLPAKNQYAEFNSTDLSGNYWTSTSVGNGKNTYGYSDKTFYEGDRNTKAKIRAACIRVNP